MDKTFAPKQVINDSHVIVIGRRYKGRTVEEVMDFDPSYISWIRSKPWGRNDSKFMELTNNVFIPDLTFGLHKGKHLEWVRDNDPIYWKFLGVSEWVQENHPKIKSKVDSMSM